MASSTRRRSGVMRGWLLPPGGASVQPACTGGGSSAAGALIAIRSTAPGGLRV
jgi:phage baseplate assembly protein gpV